MIIDVKDEARIKELEEKKIILMDTLVVLLNKRMFSIEDIPQTNHILDIQDKLIKHQRDCLTAKLEDVTDDELEFLINYCKGFINGVLDLAVTEIKNLADNARFKCESKGAAND